MKYKIFFLLPLAFTLISCTQHKKFTYSYITTDSAPVRVVNKNAQSQLAEAATSVSHTLQKDSAIQVATHPKATLKAPLDPAIIGMTQQTSLDWTGPIEPLLRKIAEVSHYKLRVLGKKPTIPVIVDIDSQNVPLADILRNATFQAEKKADVTIYPGKKTIELRYYPS